MGATAAHGQALSTFADALASGGQGPTMVEIPEGSFRMGCLNNGGGCYLSQLPVHDVNIPRFALSRYEVTFEQWDACVDAGGCNGYRPDDRGWGRGDRPVIRVSWNNAKSYVSWLSQQTGKEYRLPSESEWEYAARAGTETVFHWGNEVGSNRANCDGCGSQWDATQTAPVGSFAPNAWGLYDIHGNVWEWTEDCRGIDTYDGAPTDGSAWLAEPCSMRILRGGGWDNHSDFSRSSYRGSADATLGTDVLGLRVALTLQASTTGSPSSGGFGGGGGGGGGGVARTRPSFTDESAEFAIAENHEAEAMVGAVTARDRDGDELTYSLASEGGDHEAFAIGAGGEIRVATGMTLDHEARSSYVFTAQVSDGEDAAGGEEDSSIADDTIAVTVDVENVEEPPGPPTELIVRDAGKFGLEADWTAPAERGAGLEGYAVQFRRSVAAEWTDHAHAGTATATAIGGLTPDTRYEVRVRSLGDGDSTWTTAEAYTAPLDDAAAREHLFPLFADGDGFHSRLYLTGVSGPDNRCTLHLHGPGLEAVRFESHAAPASGMEIAPGASSIVLKTAGAEALAFGYAKLSCTEPAAARLLLSWEEGGAPTAMTNLESVASGRDFRWRSAMRWWNATGRWTRAT